MKKNFDNIIKEMEKKIEKNLYPSKTFKIIDGEMVRVPVAAAEIREYLGPDPDLDPNRIEEDKKLVGVYPHQDKWKSQIRCPSRGGGTVFLGIFDTAEEASAAYQAARKNIEKGIKVEKPTKSKPKPKNNYYQSSPPNSTLIDRDLRWLHTLHDDHAPKAKPAKPAKPPVQARKPIERPQAPLEAVSEAVIITDTVNAEASFIEAEEKFISKHFRNKTNFKGAKQRNGRYVATIQLCQKSIWLGTFDNAEAAHNAYQAARKKIDAEPSQEIASQKYKCADDFRDQKSTKTKGVNLVKGKWTARLWLKNKNYCIGTFATEQEAIAAYETAKKKILAGETLEKTKPNKRKEEGGVYQIGKRWRSGVTFGCTTIWLGSFATKEDAQAARQNAIKKILKEPDAESIAQKYKTREDFL